MILLMYWVGLTLEKILVCSGSILSFFCLAAEQVLQVFVDYLKHDWDHDMHNVRRVMDMMRDAVWRTGNINLVPNAFAIPVHILIPFFSS